MEATLFGALTVTKRVQLLRHFVSTETSMSNHPRLHLDTPATSKRSLAEQVQFALTWLKRHSTKATLEGMARYSIPSDRAYGVACKDFDNWAFCDAMSFNLFRRTPYAWTKVAQWSTRRNEFEKRTAFALLWSLTRTRQVGWRRPV